MGKIQNAFQALDSTDKDFCVNTKTDDRDVFFWSLLNQFQRVLGLPESEREKKDLSEQLEKEQTMSAAEILQDGLSSEQIRNIFLEVSHRYKIMEIINKTPPILNHNDSTILNTFASQMEKLLCMYAIPPNIRGFIESMELLAMFLEANLNIRFGNSNEIASINMANDRLRFRDKIKYELRAKLLGIPKLTPTLIENSADSRYLYRLAIENWENFRDQMNFLFKDISSGQDTTQSHE